MSKYDALWAYVKENGREDFLLTFDEIQKVLGFPIDHAFLRYKKELAAWGYEVLKISMKARTVAFRRLP